MTRKKKTNKTTLTLNDYLNINRKLSREEELEKNGGRWIAVDRPHKNKKKYDRKRDRKIDSDGLFYIVFNNKYF